jgi:hypothetical protein
MIEAKPDGCQESHPILPTLPCNQPAERMIGWHGRGEGPYRMCRACAWHSVKNRHAEDLGPFVAEAVSE